MIDKFCDYLTDKIRKDNPDIDDERAEVIQYGLKLLIGEFPKFFIMAAIAWCLGILKWTVICFFLMLPYRMNSGGFHLKTHIGCIIRNISYVCWKCFYKSDVCNTNKIQNYFLIFIMDICHCNDIYICSG